MTINDIISRIKDNQQELGLTLYGSATDEKIAYTESILKLSLAEDIKTFYKFCNGMESDGDLFRIVPLEEIIDNEKNKSLLSHQFHIAEYMDYCDMWTLDINTSTNRYSIFNEAEDRVTLTDSFAFFLERFLDKGIFEGLCDWRTESTN